MIMNGLPQRWADQFGLALAPLFEPDEIPDDGTHAVLLDGGYGSFAMSVTPEELWRDKHTAAWAWSSNLPHHVTVTDDTVAVTRWDNARPEVLSRTSVESQIDSFYSYLSTDRVRSNQRVVDYVLNLFRRIRTLVADSDLTDVQSIDVFLAFLTGLIERDRHESSEHHRITLLRVEASTELLRQLPNQGVVSLIDELRKPARTVPFRLVPSLAVRHAGSEIFQEAHFELLRAPSLDLFSYAGPAEARSVTRGGAHFTPAALARCVVEQTLLQIDDLAHRTKLTILDPACGSGSFLHEALRVLRRLGFDGEIHLIGRDVSPAAVSMADFVIRHAAADWSSNSNIHIDTMASDSLAGPLPHADVVLMNPPFMSWPALDNLRRDQMRQILGDRLRGRGDLSMAFVTRAVDCLYPGGALGVLLPSSLLTLQAAEEWRADLLDKTDLRLLASLGDYALFAHALVQVAAAVLYKPTDPMERRGSTTALITSNSTEATGNALRTLRRSEAQLLDSGEDDQWFLFQVPTSTFKARPTWRLITPRTESTLSRLLEAGAVRTSDLFTVRQGIRTGDNKAFVLDKSSYDSLPLREQTYFKPAVLNHSIHDGKLRHLYWVFYPYDETGSRLKTEHDLREAVPTYAEHFLLPRRERLASRRSLADVDREDWWTLTRSRATWAFDPAPRLVSKYFGGPGGFAADLTPEFFVVQGHVWFLNNLGSPDNRDTDDAGLPIEDLICAYVALFNSLRFIRVLEIFSPHVAGGQFNLSPRYVDHVPIPDLANLARDERIGRLVSALVELGRDPRLNDVRWSAMADEITTELYGGEFFDRV